MHERCRARCVHRFGDQVEAIAEQVAVEVAVEVKGHGGRMQGVFGSRDWIANGILFAVYHLHVPWMIPITLIDTFILSLPSRRYQSALIGIIAHSAQSVFLFALVLMLFLTP